MSETPRHLMAAQRIEVISIVQFPDRGLILRHEGVEYLVAEVFFHYAWQVDRWAFIKPTSFGQRRMGPNRWAPTRMQLNAIHPDYRELVQKYAPTWKPKKFVREL